MTFNHVSDSAVVPNLLIRLPENEVLESLRGDGTYDKQPAYDAVMRWGATPIIPPRKNAQIHKGTAYSGGHIESIH